jgi:hypothetical protein
MGEKRKVVFATNWLFSSERKGPRNHDNSVTNFMYSFIAINMHSTLNLKSQRMQWGRKISFPQKGKWKWSVCWAISQKPLTKMNIFISLKYFNSFKSGPLLGSSRYLDWHYSRAKMLSSAWMLSVQVCMVARWSIQVVEYSRLLTTQSTLKTYC